jgi:hypothetical protein
MNMKLIIALAAAGALAATAFGAHATTVTLPDPGNGNYNFTPASTYDGVTFAATNPAISGIGTSVGASQVNYFDNAFGGFLDLTFASSNSFSASLAQGFPDSAGPVTLTALLNGVTVYTASPAIGGQDAFTPVTISGVGQFNEVNFTVGTGTEFPGIAQISYGNVSAAPESGIWALMIAGLAMMGSALRLRRRQSGAVAA